jgi:hypothetical protein
VGPGNRSALTPDRDLSGPSPERSERGVQRVDEVRIRVVDRFGEAEAADGLQRHDAVEGGTQDPHRVDECPAASATAAIANIFTPSSRFTASYSRCAVAGAVARASMIPSTHCVNETTAAKTPAPQDPAWVARVSREVHRDDCQSESRQPLGEDEVRHDPPAVAG